MLMLKPCVCVYRLSRACTHQSHLRTATLLQYVIFPSVLLGVMPLPPFFLLSFSSPFSAPYSAAPTGPLPVCCNSGWLVPQPSSSSSSSSSRSNCPSLPVCSQRCSSRRSGEQGWGVGGACQVGSDAGATSAAEGTVHGTMRVGVVACVHAAHRIRALPQGLVRVGWC